MCRNGAYLPAVAATTAGATTSRAHPAEALRKKNGLLQALRARLTAAGDALVSIIFSANCRIRHALLVDSHRVPICRRCFASNPSWQSSAKFVVALLQDWRKKKQQLRLCPACQEKPMPLIVRAASRFMMARWFERFFY